MQHRARTAVADEVRRFIETGDSDPLYSAWTGRDTMDRMERGHRELLGALVAEVQRRAGIPTMPVPPGGTDLATFTRRKVEPMVRGLFAKAEQDAVLGLVERSVIFVTPDNLGSLIMECDCPHSAWDLANLYLGSVGAELLGRDAPQIVGFSEDTTCFVSLGYFRDDDPFADFVVHEVAHIFHNCRRRTAGLRETRTRERPLDIDYRKRETFAYACEAYSRILERAPRIADRKALAREFSGSAIADTRVDSAEVAALIRVACDHRNGWKTILAHCAPAPVRTVRR